MRAAIVGICGGMGKAHARMLQSLGHTVAVGVDLAPDLAAVCAEFGASPVREYAELLNRKDIDLVIVSLPPQLHPRVCADLLRGGLPVLCEKPVALRTADAADLLKVNGFLMAGHVLRFDAGMQTLRRLIQSGRLGQLRTMTARKCWPAYTSWRLGPGGGAVMIKDVHYWDLIPWLTGAAPLSVYAAGGDLFHGAGVEDAYHLIMRLEGGAIFHLESAWWSPKSSAHLFEVIGTEARAVVEKDRVVVTDRAGTTEEIPLAQQDMLAVELTECLAALRAGEKPPCTLLDGLRAVAVGEAILESLRTGNPVSVQPYLEAIGR